MDKLYLRWQPDQTCQSNIWEGNWNVDLLRLNTPSNPLSFVFTGPTWLQWVLNVEHGGPVAIHHVLLDLIFGNVATTIFYSDTGFQVVEVATVELEEFDEQNADVDVGTADVVPVVKLESTQ